MLMHNQANVHPTGREDWPVDLQAEFERDQFSGIVGSVLVSETEKVRVWHLHLPVGTRCGFHRHVLNYFWTALSPGKARAYNGDGTIADATYSRGETKHFNFAEGESFVHCLENIGATDLTFTTVEFLDSDNPPLPVPDGVRLDGAA